MTLKRLSGIDESISEDTEVKTLEVTSRTELNFPNESINLHRDGNPKRQRVNYRKAELSQKQLPYSTKCKTMSNKRPNQENLGK